MRTPDRATVRNVPLALALILTVAWAPLPLAGAAGSETLLLTVEGMTNEQCEEEVEGFLLGDLDGLRSVVANHEADTVTVEFDPDRLRPEEVAAAIDWCPSYQVTGSDTHHLDLDEVRESVRQRFRCCNGEV